MSLVESLYEADQIFTGFKNNQNFGIPPNPVEHVIFNGVSSLKCFFNILDTIIDESEWCEVKGVLVRIKMGSAPVDIYDGDFVGDYTGSDLTSHAIGSNNPIIINGLTNFSTYYVRFFPYSDHGIYNFNINNIGMGVPKDTIIYGFHQNFLDLNPSTTITYIEDCIGFTPMMTNITTGVYTDGSWSMWDWLQENLPYMVRKTGIKDYALDPNDYTKKLDGSASDISNTSYDGGAFAWLPKLYMKEVYAADGNSRDVYFARSNTGLYTSDFYPVGFVDPSNQVMEGVWLPMFYMGASNSSISEDAIDMFTVASLDNARNRIESWSSRSCFFGGPIISLLRDLEYLLYKNTNIMKCGGYGIKPDGILAHTWKNRSNLIVGNGRFFGNNVSKMNPNKAFHSNVLFSYSSYILDPYIGFLPDRIIKIRTDYFIPNINNFDGYINTGIIFPIGLSGYSSALTKIDNLYGSFPLNDGGSDLTGLCDHVGSVGSSGNLGHACIFGTYINGQGGPACFSIGRYEYGAPYNSDISLAMLLLPEIGYSPT